MLVSFIRKKISTVKIMDQDQLQWILLLSSKQPMSIDTYPEIMDMILEMVCLLERVYEEGLRKGHNEKPADENNSGASNTAKN